LGKDNGFAPEPTAIQRNQLFALLKFGKIRHFPAMCRRPCLAPAHCRAKHPAAPFPLPPFPLPALSPLAPTRQPPTTNQEHNGRRSLCPITVAPRNLLTQLSFSRTAKSRRRRLPINFFFCNSG
jgi:hypothetical protein